MIRNNKKGNYINKCMHNGASKIEARAAWDKAKDRDGEFIGGVWSPSEPNNHHQPEYEFDSDINENGQRWHDAGDL